MKMKLGRQIVEEIVTEAAGNPIPYVSFYDSERKDHESRIKFWWSGGLVYGVHEIRSGPRGRPATVEFTEIQYDLENLTEGASDLFEIEGFNGYMCEKELRVREVARDLTEILDHFQTPMNTQGMILFDTETKTCDGMFLVSEKEVRDIFNRYEKDSASEGLPEMDYLVKKEKDRSKEIDQDRSMSVLFPVFNGWKPSSVPVFGATHACLEFVENAYGKLSRRDPISIDTFFNEGLSYIQSPESYIADIVKLGEYYRQLDEHNDRQSS
jgi:hypothetical protein